MASGLLPPAQPAFVLRGHSAQIHALHFTKGNARLLTADADGWIVSWNLAFKRPVAVWRAHSNAILGVGSWGYDRIITHGRDHKLIVWKLNEEDEAALDRTLPIDANDVPHRHPWLLYALNVNTLNFCPFAMCRDGMPQILSTQKAIKDNRVPDPILIAVPNTIDSGGIDIYQLPTQVRAANIGADRSVTTGMVMAIAIQAESTRIQVAAGYESGHTMVFIQNDPAAAFQRLYSAKPHTEPDSLSLSDHASPNVVLSLALSPLPSTTYLTTSADANISRHPFPTAKSIWNTEMKPIKTVPTKHSGQQGCSYRNDGKVFATAGWDGAGRVYSGKTMKEVAVLKWGGGVGCYATAFAEVGARCGKVAEVGGVEEGDKEAMVEASTSRSTTTSSEIALPPVGQSSVVTSVQQRRDGKARSTHWLAIGAKDGKVSLWDIY